MKPLESQQAYFAKTYDPGDYLIRCANCEEELVENEGDLCMACTIEEAEMRMEDI